MRLSYLLPFVVAPLALAAPEPNPVAAPAPQSTGGLLNTISELEGLLSQSNLNNLQTIITNGAKLLSDNNLNVLQNILTNANSLLTKDFVDNTTILIGDATPVRAFNFFALTLIFPNKLANFSIAHRGCFETAWFTFGLTLNDLHIFVIDDSIRNERSIDKKKFKSLESLCRITERVS